MVSYTLERVGEEQATSTCYSPSLLVLARGGDELTVGKFRETLSLGCDCGPSRFGLGLNSALKSALSKPSSNWCIRSTSSTSTSAWYCSLSTALGTAGRELKKKWVSVNELLKVNSRRMYRKLGFFMRFRGRSLTSARRNPPPYLDYYTRIRFLQSYFWPGLFIFIAPSPVCILASRSSLCIL